MEATKNILNENRRLAETIYSEMQDVNQRILNLQKKI